MNNCFLVFFNGLSFTIYFNFKSKHFDACCGDFVIDYITKLLH